MKNLFLKNWHKQLLWIVGLSILLTINAYAATTGNLPFNSNMDNFKGNFAAWIFEAAVILWMATCLMLAFGEWASGMKIIINILFWLSLAFGGGAGLKLLFSTGAVF
jgi:type IV secretory pathway VirB2 component (pilin)